MALIKTFEVKLSEAQFRMFRDPLEGCEAKGDCRLVRIRSAWWIEFSDYEGVLHTSSLLDAVSKASVMISRSWGALKRKIDAGVLSAAKAA